MTHTLNRRAMIRGLAGAFAAGWAGLPAAKAFAAQGGGDQIPGAARGEMNRLMWQFNRNFTVPAMSVAISRNGAFVYDRAIGMAIHEKVIQAEQSSQFRIGAVTMPITAVTVFSLIEKGQLHLTDKVFGPSGVLGTKYGKGPYPQYVTDITVDHLLSHTAGGWPSDSTDPMFQHDSWDQEKLISWTIQNVPLSYAPGQHWALSDFGYCVLGRVIEQVTGTSYESYVQNNILAPCGISEMCIGRNKEGQRFPNEVEYYGQYSENPYKFNLERMDSCGGWIATSTSLVQFLDHITGSGENPGLLKPETIRLMTTPSPVFAPNSPAQYARGWNVQQDGYGNWWHNGSLPGSTTMMIRTNTGMCCAVLTNTRTEPHDEMDAALNQLVWNLVNLASGRSAY